MHGTPYCAFAGLTLPHFFGDRPGVAALSVQVLHDVFVARFIAVLAQPKNSFSSSRSSTSKPIIAFFRESTWAFGR
jgi:hypothetical protein